ncbi:dynein heavy chain 2, axonemal [Elysia marginata]|uniref:Dynein heavy chain 2, axonemal n=1 Tax=Elysia marginata TaxID=1093978 RepID=A0AAV4ET22_9GAST|nr:dynein heavy chain 2, axonemal [Elysia marginata]
MSTTGSKPASARSRRTPTKSASKKGSSKHESQNSLENGEIEQEDPASAPEVGGEEGEETVAEEEQEPEQEPEEEAIVPASEMIRKRIVVAGMPEINLTPDHENMIDNFLEDQDVHILVAYNDSHRGFNLEHTIPNFPVNQLCYFIKSLGTTTVDSDNFLTNVQYGAVKGGHIESLLRVMMGIYAPIFFENRSWPDSIKNDFSAQLHRFLASLTDTRWKLEGKTVLYVPTEGMKINEEDAAKNKELVQRLESEYCTRIA